MGFIRDFSIFLLILITLPIWFIPTIITAAIVHYSLKKEEGRERIR